MQTLEELLTGRSEDEVAANLGRAKIVALGCDGRAIVVITVELETALANVDEATLSAVATP